MKIPIPATITNASKPTVDRPLDVRLLHQHEILKLPLVSLELPARHCGVPPAALGPGSPVDIGGLFLSTCTYGKLCVSGGLPLTCLTTLLMAASRDSTES